jgi:MFS family permease
MSASRRQSDDRKAVRPVHGTLAVLQRPNFLLFVASRFFTGAALTLMRATIAWHVFDITGSAFHLGLVGLMQFVPTLLLSLPAGAVADSYDRRRVILTSQSVALVAALTLYGFTHTASIGLPLLYTLIAATAVASAFEGPSRGALLPTVVPRHLFPDAVAVHSTVQNLAWIIGPVIMGFAIAAYGIASAYLIRVVLIGGSLLLFLFIRPEQSAKRSRVSFAAMREGVAFVRRRQAILGAMALDMFAVIFASATALLPLYANEILHVGPRGYGLLSAALEIGSLTMALILLARGPLARPGRALLIAVGVFGVATVVFGLSRWFPLSFAAFVVAGMADQVSVVARSVIIQLSTPDELRGRVTSVNLVFIGASNQLGAMESGFVAALTSATFAVVSGGVGCLLVLALIALRMPELREYRVGGEVI